MSIIAQRFFLAAMVVISFRLMVKQV
jgi:hypothetical protein